LLEAAEKLNERVHLSQRLHFMRESEISHNSATGKSAPSKSNTGQLARDPFARTQSDLARARYLIDDVRIRKWEEISVPHEVIKELPLSEPARALVGRTRQSVHELLHGVGDGRLLAVVGPCSVHDPQAALEYARWLCRMRDLFSSRLLIVMRIYFEKPRTKMGWKGLINDPYLDGSFRLNEGVRLARNLLLAINELGIPAATEFVDLVTPQYVADLISWGSIGARTTESQVHRELASGLSCPVGFKNGTGGNVEAAVNAVFSARNPHHFLSVTKMGVGAVISTTGNEDCHVILRGGAAPNYDKETVQATARLLRQQGLPDKMLIDCSHGNCQGDHSLQTKVADEVCRQLEQGSSNILGVMVESNLVSGSQRSSAGQPLIYGQSITDPCIGLEDTYRILDKLANCSHPGTTASQRTSV
jgi:3-deoxy-7-phosphoheptulonate synthase